jgi:hypothetical protein
VGARVEPELAQAVRRLAKLGNRTRSREVTRRFVGSSSSSGSRPGGTGRFEGKQRAVTPTQSVFCVLEQKKADLS